MNIPMDTLMHTTAQTLALFSMPGGMEWVIILLIALLIFGKRLPEVGKSLGKGIVEFKKGLQGVKEEVASVDREVEEAVRKAERDEQQAKLESQSVLKDKAAVTSTGDKVSP